MEETQLLCALVYLIFTPLFASLDVHEFVQEMQDIHPSTGDLKRACALKTTADEIIEKRRVALLHDTPQETDLFVFVSSSMHKELLLELGQAAKQYGGVLVLRGLVNDSFKETIRDFSCLFKEDIGVLIDPQLFEDYEIKHVPTFVMTDGNRNDQLSGAVSPQYVLHTFADKGELGTDAQRRLDP